MAKPATHDPEDGPAADRRRPGPRPEIRVYPGGPLLIRGEFALTDADGRPIPRRRKVVALCRCGHSALLPWCDGNHKLVKRFVDREKPAPGR